ncbi:MAG: TetR/AcrR family transcriptional regulator [Pleurocapsa sp. MO_226.B13]|nr:TetR/AcrR family transcriptional regulator [Pleurocapsa sp. MO_226.B13]
MESKLTKAEQTMRTRRAIIERARYLFTHQGYAATGTEEIIENLGITRGALYHQFRNKQGVFKAVVAEAFDEMTAYITSKTEPHTDTWQQLVVGCHAFLEIAQREDIQRLIFIEAPTVLEAEVLAEYDKSGFEILHKAIIVVTKEGKLKTFDTEGFAHLVNGSLNELAAWIAQTKDPEKLKIAQALIENLLTKYSTSN